MRFLIALLVLGWGFPLAAQDTLRVLSWNIQMLPNLWSPFSSSLRKAQKIRTPWIIEYCRENNWDVIVFQEVFDREIKARLRRKLRKTYPYQVRPRTRGLKYSNGILIVSRYPARYVDHVIYNNGDGSDKMAAKGCNYVEINANGQKVHIAGTHLQAGGRPIAQEIRGKQYRQIRKLLDKHRHDSIPQLIVGDLNTEKHDSARYNLMLTELDANDHPIDDPHPYTIDPKNSWKDGDDLSQLDYVLVRSHRSGIRCLRQRIIRPVRQYLGRRKKYKGKQIDLADHYGVEAVLLLGK